MTTSASRVAELGTVLGVWAHPDDEAYLSAGLMALARDNGQRVVCVTATRGELGTPDPGGLATGPAGRRAHPRARAQPGDPRRHRARMAAVPGRGVRRGAPSEAVERLCAVLDRVRPDTVVTFGPDGLTGHDDHRTVSAWTAAAFDRAAPPGSRLLHATLAERRAPRWGALTDSLGIYPPGLPVLTPASGWPSTWSWTRTSPGARSGRWPPSRPRRPG